MTSLRGYVVTYLVLFSALLGACTETKIEHAESTGDGFLSPVRLQQIVDYVSNPLHERWLIDQTVYPFAKNAGIRMDSHGDGWFGSVRGYGATHSGVDFLLPEGTHVVSPCTGHYKAGKDGGFGYWIQLICQLPRSRARADAYAGAHYSLLLAHLQIIKPDLYRNGSGRINKGDVIAKSGRTGNAWATEPHAHVDLAIHESLASASAEMHTRSGVGALGPKADSFLYLLRTGCLHPSGISRRTLHAGQPVAGQEPIHFGKRVDPFLFFLCTSKDIPTFTKHNPSKVQIPWSRAYEVPKGLGINHVFSN